MFKDAILSKDRKYRYSLIRSWDQDKGFLNVIGLNPSTADEREDDPTIRRCISFAKRWGLGGLVMTNLFAYRATKPEVMMLANDPIGELNDSILIAAATESDMVLAAWGTKGVYLDREKEVIDIVPRMMNCLKKTKNGHPQHPLYISADTKPVSL